MNPDTFDNVLADFRKWLTAQPEAFQESNGTLTSPVDLMTLVEQFTALRHEVNLQSSAVRAQQEQSGQALDALQKALDAVERSPGTPGFAAPTFPNRPTGATAEIADPVAIDRVLSDFRNWLTAPPEVAGEQNGPPATAVDLITLVGQFTALRHDVNLQTRAVRLQQEQSGQTLDALQKALDAVERGEEQRIAGEAERQDEPLRPLLKTLVDVHDALALAHRQVARMRDALPELALPTPPTLKVPTLPTLAAPDAELPPRSFWDRLFGRQPIFDSASARQLQEQTAEYVRTACQLAVDENARLAAEQHAASQEQLGQAVDSILTGYTMSLQRLERALEQHGLETVDCVGQPFDPEIMEVAEIVHEPGRRSTEVLDVVRDGYLWRGKLFRYAQVRVARPV